MRKPICEHLQPLADALRAAGIDIRPTESPYSDDHTWWLTPCTYDEPALRKRLGLAPSLQYNEYMGMSAGSDATWMCKEHGVVFMGPHPDFAEDGTPRLS